LPKKVLIRFCDIPDACNAASVLWLPFRAYTFLIRLGFSQTDSTSPLADSSLLLLLVLINHSSQQAHVQQSPHFLNPYQAAIQGLQDSEDVGTDAESGRGQTASGISAVPFSGLYNALGAGLEQEPSVLLLYVLLHKCHKFQQYVLVRSDADTILLPLLDRYALRLLLICSIHLSALHVSFSSTQPPEVKHRSATTIKLHGIDRHRHLTHRQTQ